jgi:hypothetical protein
MAHVRLPGAWKLPVAERRALAVLSAPGRARLDAVMRTFDGTVIAVRTPKPVRAPILSLREHPRFQTDAARVVSAAR